MPESVLEPWKVSLHGGHSRQYCDHAADGLEDILDAAVAFGYHVFGVTEHAPRFEAHRLYDEERDMGWTIETVQALFEEYARRLDELLPRYADRITLLKGFEAEVIPEDRYTEVMLDLRRRLGFEYMVGSVHWVGGHIIDYRPSDYAAAVAACGGLEKMAIRYYETVAEMVRNLRPEVVGHLDVISCRAPSEAEVSTPPVRKAAHRALEVIRESGAILDVNTGGYRKGLAWPFPAPWLVTAAREMGIPFCFGDDSHRVAHVGAGIEEAREHLLGLGVESVTTLVRGVAGGLERRAVSLG
jgi:histidinol-phosphatase (PHP family)